MKKIFIMLVSLIVVSGCTTPAMTVDATRDLHLKTAEVCTDLTVEMAKDRLKKAWENCYLGQGPSETMIVTGSTVMIVPVYGGGSSMSVEMEKNESGYSLALRNFKQEIYLMADIASAEECESKIIARGWNFAWDRAAQYTEKWIENPDAPGPFAVCR
ncbi:hypothetical protein [Marinobacterium lacunae]|uniref:hypothetical protein n=1 Tax=Marinobacterium lacunae TaxID=1232683 RepID=UPI00056B336D|nr:hypothetical protein [Marinobacterium lacunae]